MITILRPFDPFSRDAMPYRTTLAWGSILLLGALTGCTSTREGDRLRRELFRFAEYFDRTVQRMAIEVQENEPQREVAAQHLDIVEFWQSRFVQECNTAISHDNPQQGLLYVWMLSRRVQNFLEADESTRFLGESRPIVLKTARRVQERAEGIAAAYLKEREFRKMKTVVSKLANDFPFKSAWLEDLSLEHDIFSNTKDGEDVLATLLEWAMKPIWHVGEMLQDPFSTEGLYPGLERATNVLEDFPKEACHQLVGLADELEKNPTVRKVADSFERFSKSAELVTKALTPKTGTAEELPKGVDRSQPDLGETVVDVRKAVQSIERTVEGVPKSAEALQASAEAFGQAARDIGQAAKDIGQAKKEIGTLWSTPHRRSEGVSSQSKEPFTLQEVTDSADAVTQTVVEIRGLVRDLREVAETKPAFAWMEALDAVLNRIGKTMKGVVTYAGICGLVLMGLLFAFMLIYRAITKRFLLARSAT